MIRYLNLYAGLGGNRKLLTDVKVTAVERDPKIAAVYQELYPNDEVVIGDAREYLLSNYKNFDWIWTSPKCQANTKMIRSGRNRKPIYPDLRCYEQAIFLKHNFNGSWVVENVKPYYKPLIEPQYVGRHAFWSNLDIKPMINEPKFKNFINRQNLSDKKDLMDWLGIHYDKNIYYEGNHCPTQILRNCVHPLVGQHVFNCKAL